MGKTATLFTGYDCWVRFAAGIAAGTALLQSNNNAGLKEGEKIAIDFYGRVRSFKVEIDKKVMFRTDDERKLDAKIVLLSNQVGNADFESTYWKGSSVKFLAHQIFGSTRAKWSLATTALTIIGACGAAYNSAQTQTCSGVNCITPFSRLLLGVSAVAAIVGWAKENLP